MMENGSFSSSSEASSVSSIANSDDVEVRKLKDLVKKLEKQNEHLRHRTGKLSSNANKFSKSQSKQGVAGGDAFTNHSMPVPKSSTVNGFSNDYQDVQEVDETDPIVGSVLHGDEFTWLYQSPKVSDREDDNGKYYSSPVQWLKEEFESPSTPQLASARKNILYKIGMIDRASPDLSYLTQNVEKRLLFNSEDYKLEDPTDVKVMARIQQEELNKDREAAIRNDVIDNSHINSNHRKGSYGEDTETSPASATYTHHLPVPSQTMTTAHGLYPAHFDNDTAGMRGRRSHPQTKSNPSSVGSSPRNKSPARSRQAKSPSRRSLPNPSRTSSSSSISSGRSSSPLRSSLTSELPRESNKSLTYNGTSQSQQPTIRSSLVAPSRMSRLQQKSGLPAPGASKGIPAPSRSISAPRAASPMTSQRRSLPRPSQTSSTMRYTSNRLSNSTQSRSSSTVTSPRVSNPTPSQDLWGDDEVY